MLGKLPRAADILTSQRPLEACEETLAAHKARLSELRTLVAQIATDVGLEAGGLLECEVDALGKRLEDVRTTLTTLASVAEARSQDSDELVRTKSFLESVHKSLSTVGHDEDEDTLSKLRSHLLALGKTESQVTAIRDKSLEMNEKPRTEARTETSVVEILELWQQVFRETFQQYHRLSARLVRSQDGAAALQLWQEYLLHVQTFLSSSLPEDYDALCETQRLCEVHQNLLTSQHAVLLSRKDGSAEFSKSVQEQFNSLANLHNETLARIMERHSEVNKRLELWETYRKDQSQLLAWLRDMARDQSRLQLRYLHLRRLGKVQDQINTLLDRIPQGRSQVRDLETRQAAIVRFCDEALGTSIKMESIAISERIGNLEAGLKSWKDFLNRVQDLSRTFEEEIKSVEAVCDDVTNQLSQPAPVTLAMVAARLELFQDLRRQIGGLGQQLDEVGVTYDQLKECVSPHDAKALSQRLWLLMQRQGDLSHQLLVAVHVLEDRMEMQHVLHVKHTRFMTWAADLVARYERRVSNQELGHIESEARAKRLDTEVKAEVDLKRRDRDWLVATATSLMESSKATGPGEPRRGGEASDRLRREMEGKLAEVEEAWERVNSLATLRATRRTKVMSTMEGLWARIEGVRTWLSTTERQLEAPVVLEKGSKKMVDKLLKDHDTVQRSIEQQSANVGEVLNLCELLLADPALSTCDVDTTELETAVQSLERRWKTVCLASSERKQRIVGAWELLQQLAKLCKDHEAWVTEREGAVAELARQAHSPRLNDIQPLASRLEAEGLEMESREPALRILDASYSKLAQDSRLSAENVRQIAGPARALISRWHEVAARCNDITAGLERVRQIRDDFIRSQNASIVVLTHISAKLAQVELTPDPTERLIQLEALDAELNQKSASLTTADQAGLELMKTCSEKSDIAATQGLVDEYQLLWSQIRERFQQARNKCLVESKETQVSTLLFESDTEVQVNTLAAPQHLTSRDAYGMELDSALRECNQHLHGLMTILDGPSQQPALTHHTLAKVIASCTSSMELVQHLHQTLLDTSGVTTVEARSPQVEGATSRFQDLVTRAKEREKEIRDASERGRLTCPLCSCRNWQQLDNDLWRLEQWIQYAEAVQRNRKSPPRDMEALEDVIQDHRELLLDLDSHKSIVVSLNIVGEHLADHAEDVDRARLLRDRLAELNTRWDGICALATRWQATLQEALMDNSEFHDTIDELVAWLDTTEAVIRHAEPIDLSQDEIIIQAQFRKFRDLSKELERMEPRVVSLQEAAAQLLDSGPTRERLNGLRLKLTGLRRLVNMYTLRLGAVLGRDPNEPLSLPHQMLRVGDTATPDDTSLHTNGDDVDTTVLRRGCRFLTRVIRASLPIQALMLLLLGAAMVREDDFNCTFSNNARFQSQYPYGPPAI